MTNVDTNTFS